MTDILWKLVERDPGHLTARIAGFQVDVYVCVHKAFRSPEMPNLKIPRWFFSLCWGEPEELAQQADPDQPMLEKSISFGSQFIGVLSEGLSSQEEAIEAVQFAVSYLTDRNFLRASEKGQDKLLSALADRLVSRMNGR